MKVHVAIFIYRGVLNNLEVFAEPGEAEAKADEWRKDSNPDDDVVDVLERKVIYGEADIRVLALEPKYENALKRSGILTVAQLCSCTEQEFCYRVGIGKITALAVKQALSARGLRLAEQVTHQD